MNYQISQGFGQTAGGVRSRKLRSVYRIRQYELLRRLGRVLVRCLPMIVVLNLILAYAVGKMETQIEDQSQVQFRLEKQKELLVQEHRSAYARKNLEKLAASRLGMEPIAAGHYGRYVPRKDRFVFN